MFALHNWLEQCLNGLLVAFVLCACLFRLEGYSSSSNVALVVALFAILFGAVGAAGVILVREIRGVFVKPTEERTGDLQLNDSLFCDPVTGDVQGDNNPSFADDACEVELAVLRV